ncbi:PKD domain-containing protein [Flavobacteriales bacterium]|nr:PKD domain-containing protein [Flavobacteriales bacterium]
MSLKGAHIVGGEITYRCLDSNRYEITLTLFRDCNGIAFANGAQIGCFNGGTGALVTSTYVPLDTSQFVPLNAVSPCLIIPPGTCLEQATYIDTVTLLPDTNGYDISFSVCCRSNASNNITIPGGWNGGAGSSFHTRIPPNDTLCNSSPTFNSYPPVVLCINDPINLDYSATDADGDSLSYEFVNPYTGGSSRNPTPNPSPPPYGTVNWSAGFNVNYQIPSSPAFSLNSSTGLLTGKPSSLGNYVTGVTVKEYRNGVLINETRRDFLMIIVNCIPTTVSIANPGVICDSYTVTFGNGSISTPTTTYLWDFGDTSTLLDTSTLFNPQYTYPDTGVYIVTLISDPYSPACADTSIRQIFVYPLIGPAFTKPLNQCLIGNSFDFTAAGIYFNTTQIDWDFGPTSTPRSDTSINPTGITYNSRGNKTITLRYQDFGCDTTIFEIIEVYQSPIADFSFSNNNCIDYSIDFYDSSLYVGDYHWDFGLIGSTADTSTLANPTFTFPDTGLYTVRLVVDSNSSTCPDTIYKQVRIDPLLTPFFTSPMDQCLVGNSFDFNAGGAFYPTTQINWNFGPTATPSIDTVTNPTGIVFSNSGSKTISIRYQDFGCDTIFIDSVNVYDNPVSSFSYTDDDHCNNFIIHFSDSSSFVGDYYWDFGVRGIATDTSTSANPSFTYPDSGTYTVMLVISSQYLSCPDTSYQIIIIHPLLTPFFTSPMDQCLVGNSFDFNAGGAFYPTTQINWNFGPTATPSIDTVTNPTGIVFSNSGSKTISIRYQDFGCDTIFIDSVNVFDNPVSSFTYVEDHCNNFTIQFIDSSSFVGDYYWDFDVLGSTIDTSTSANPIFTYLDSGTYTVMLVIGSQYLACPDTSYQTIRVDPILNPYFVRPANQCFTGNSFNFSAGGSFYPGTQIDWDFGASASPSSSNIQNPTGIVFNTSGKKAVTIRYQDFGCDTSFVDTIHVYELPVANFIIDYVICVDLVTSFYDSSLFAGTYQWDFGLPGITSDTSTLQNPVFTYQDTGIYTVRLIVTSQYLLCAPDTIYKQVRIFPVLDPQFNLPANQCFVGNAFNFIADSNSIYYPTTQFTWDFGPSATPNSDTTLNPPTVIFNTSGKKAISLIFTDFVCVITKTDTIEVFDNPVSNFGFTDNNCHDLSVQFIDSTQFTTEYYWNFGVIPSITDTSSIANPLFSYPDSGVYTIRLIADGNESLCPDTSYKQISLNPILAPYFSKPANQCFSGNSFDFTAGGTSYPGTLIDWDFGPTATPSTSNISNPTGIIFSTSGKKAITIRYREFGCDTIFVDTIEVYDNPVSNFSFTNNNCFNLTAQFSDSSLFATGHNWDFGVTTSITDTSTSSNPTFTYPDSGVYTVRLIVDGNISLCPDTSYQQITLNPLLNPYYSKPVDQCLNINSFDFNAGGAFYGNTQIDWNFGSSATPSTSSAQNPTDIVFNSIGKKPITIRYQEFGCDTSYTDTIEVFSSPFSNYIFTNNNCVDYTIDFSDSSLFTDFYYWDFGVTGITTDTSSAKDPTFTFPDSGIYTVMLISGSYSTICPDTSYKQVVLHPLLNPFFNIPDNQCINGNSFDFNAGGNFYGSTQIDWDFGSSAAPNTSLGSNPTGISFNSSGLKPITIRYNAFGCDTSYTDTIEIYNSPSSNFSFTENNCIDFDIQFTDSSLFTDFYYWDFGVPLSTSDTSSMANPSFTFPDSGIYTVMLVAGTFDSICPDTSYQQVVMHPLLRPSFNVPQNQCLNGNSFNFNAGGNFYGSTQIDWDFGPTATPSFISGSNPTGIVYNTVGKKIITVRYRAFGCDTSYTDSIEVYVSPLSNFSFSDNNCVDYFIQFSDSSLFSKDYYWDFGDKTTLTDTSTVANPTYTFPDSGIYTVMLVMGRNSSICPDTLYQQVVMHPLLSPFFVAPTEQCLNENSFDFNAGGAFYNSTQIDWNFGPTATPGISSIANPNGILFSTFGTKPITLRYSAFGCDTSYTDTIEVYPSPLADFRINKNEYCIGDSNVIDLISLSDISWIHYWDFEETTFSNVLAPIYIYEDTGLFDITLVVENSYGCFDTMIQPNSITIHPSPTALFSPVNLRTSYYYPYVLFTNNSLNFNFSTFDDGAGAIVSTFTELKTDYAIEGFYYPQLIVENNVGCYDTLMGEIFYEMKYNLFVPNSFTPNDDGLNDVFRPVINSASLYKFSIYNKWGELLFFTENLAEGWDGTDTDGVMSQSDTYVYKIIYHNLGGDKKEIFGHVNLLR